VKKRMKSKMKMALGIALVLAVFSMAFLSIPALAYANGAHNADRKRLMERDEDCDRDMLQTGHKDGSGGLNQDCNHECEGAKQRTRTHHGAEIHNCKENMEQTRHRNRQGA